MAKKARTKSAKKGRPKQENRAQHRKAGHIEQELRKLFKGQAPIAGLLASIFASTATENAKLLRFVTDRHRISQAFTEPIDPARWLRLYRQHRHITQVVGSAMGCDDWSLHDFADAVRSFATLARRDRNAAAEQLKQDLAELGQDGLMDLQNAIWADAACFMAEVSDDEVKVDPEEAANALKQPEIRFFVTVVLPCFLVYREHPTRMMHLARLGDEVALERLLRIDKYVLHEPRIRNHVVESAYARSPRRFTRLVRAIGGRAEGKMDDRTMKVRLASAITKPLAAMKIEINEPQVRGSFDLAAKVQGRGVDKDLPPSPESLSKALQRERKLWHPRLSDKS